MSVDKYTKEDWKRLSKALITEISSIAIGLFNWTLGERDKSIEEKFAKIKEYYVNQWLSGLLPNRILTGINFLQQIPDNIEDQLFKNLET